MESNKRFDRRDVLKSTAGLTAVGLAGCLGGGDGGDGSDGSDGSDGGEMVSIEAGCSSTGSTSFAACQAIQSVVDSHAENVEFVATAPGGDPASIRQLSQGEVDANTAGNFIMSAAANDEEPFNEQPVEQLGHSGLTYLTIYMYWTAVEGSGIESLEQAIEEDVGIWGFPPQWGLRRLLRTNMQGTDQWEAMQENLVGIAAEDVAGAIEEERVQVFTSYVSNLVSPPGWMVEVDSRHDIKAVDVGDWYWEGVDGSPAGNVDGVTESGYEQDLGADELHTWTEGFNVYFAPDVPADAVYEILDISNNNWEEAREALPAYPDHSDPSAMTASFPDFTPVHAGAADWLKENDGWNDSWTDGGEM